MPGGCEKEGEAAKIDRKKKISIIIFDFIIPPAVNPKVSRLSTFPTHFKTYRNDFEMSKLKRGRLNLPLS